ncbi:hypothetical protein CY35_05G091200 [Sphagnum magellanicum]|nr:hypothetical protein CY35_05G091200 [Sphagnum magellanicum]
MKRFFKAMERDGSFKKQALSQAAAHGGGYVADGGAEKQEPSKFMAWNAISFLLRLKSDRDECCLYFTVLILMSLLSRFIPTLHIYFK